MMTTKQCSIWAKWKDIIEQNNAKDNSPQCFCSPRWLMNQFDNGVYKTWGSPRRCFNRGTHMGSLVVKTKHKSSGLYLHRAVLIYVLPDWPAATASHERRLDHRLDVGTWNSSECQSVIAVVFDEKIIIIWMRIRLKDLKMVVSATVLTFLL